MRKLLPKPLQHRETALAVLATAIVLVAGCSNNDLSLDPLPPIQTTTTTTTSTTIPDTNRYFYEVRSGDTLSAIAAGFGVPMKQIVELNELENASDIRELERSLRYPRASSSSHCLQTRRLPTSVSSAAIRGAPIGAL